VRPAVACARAVPAALLIAAVPSTLAAQRPDSAAAPRVRAIGDSVRADSVRADSVRTDSARTDSATSRLGRLRRAALGAPGDSGPPPRRWRALPVLGSAPETGVQFGGMLIRVTRPAGARATSRPTTDRILARATTRQQIQLEYERDAWFADDAWRVNTNVEYSRFPLAFYGFGASSPEAAEEFYRPRTITGSLLVQRRLQRGLYVGAGYALARTWMRRLDPDGVLVTNTIPGSRGGTVATLDLSLVADTRDNVYAPRRGHWVTAQWSPSRRALGSQFTFARTLLDARLYRPLGARTSLALQGVLDDMAGTPPFDRLPTIGTSSIMRAYERGRYREQTLAAAQLELRRDVHRRLAVAAWGGIGTVASSVGALGDARVLPSAGVGGRWYLFPSERLAARLDLAFGRAATGIYVGIGEAF
jgi:hypothetical protein